MSKQMEESGGLIEEKLLQAWKEEQRFFHLRGMARFLIWLVAMVLVDLVVDWQIFFRSRWETPGILLLVLNGMILLWVMWHEWFRHLKPFDPLRVSLEVEKKHPELRSVLVSFTQLKDFNAEEAKASAALLDAMRQQAISLTRPLDFREVVDFRRLTTVVLVSLVSVAAFAAITFEWQEQMKLLFKRLLGENVEYPTETKITSTLARRTSSGDGTPNEELTGNITIMKGESVTIVTKVQGIIPETGSLFVRLATGEERSVVTKRNGDEFIWEMSNISENRNYYVEVGDDRSENYGISVSPEPQITETNVLLTYPEYLDRNASREDTLKLVVPQGTRIQWNLKCHPPMRTVAVTLGNEKRDANVSANGKEAVFEAMAEKTFKYTFHWTERTHGFEYNATQHLVRVEPDRIPDVELMEPSSNGVATVNKVLQLVARATDDHQLGEAILLYSINGGEEKRLTIGKLSGTQKEIRYRWPLNGLSKEDGKLEPSDKISFSIEVSDRRPPLGTHINLSATRSLTILSEEQYLTWFKAELEAQREIIVKAKDSEKRATTEVGKLKAEEKKE